MHSTRVFVMAICLLLGWIGTPPLLAIPIADIQRETPVDFEKEILPILQKNCLACHNASDANGDLVLESPQGMLKGGDNGSAIVKGKGAESLLLTLASHSDDPAMPPPDNDVGAKNLTPNELGLLKLWIDQGAQSGGFANVLSPQAWRPLPPGDHPIYTLALSPDGQFAACGRANQIFIYHVQTGQLITKLNDPALSSVGKDGRPGIAHLDVVQSLKFSQQGDLLASGGFRTVKLWRYPRDVQQAALAGPAEVKAVAVSPDRKLIALAGADNIIRLWPVEDQPAPTSELQTLAGHTGEIRSLSFTADGTRLFSAAADKTVRVWNVADGSLVGRLDAPAELNAVTTLLMPQAQPQPIEGQPASETIPPIEQLATGDAGNLIRLWNVPSLPTPLAEAPVNASVLAVSKDRSLLAIANAAGVVRVVKAETNELVHTWQASEVPIHALALHVSPAQAESPDELADAAATAVADEAKPLIRLATANEDGTVRLFDATTGEVQLVLHGSLSAINSIDFNIDGTMLVAGSASGAVTIWSLESSPARSLEKSDTPATVSIVSSDGKLLATSGLSGGRPAILVRDLESGNVLHVLLGHEGPVAALAFSADGARIVSGSADKTARVWDLGDAKFPEVARFPGHTQAVTAVTFNNDATGVLSGSADASVKLWAVADAQEVMAFAGHAGAIVGVAMPNNQPVSASADKTIRFWNATNGQATRTLTETAGITALALSRDAIRLAVAVVDKSIKVYQVSDGAALITLAGHQTEIGYLAFSPDNTRLVSADGKQAIVWEMSDGRLLELIPRDGIASATYGSGGDKIILSDQQGGTTIETMRFAAALRGMEQPISKVAYHPGGQLIVTACADGTIRGFNATNFQQTYSANHGAAVNDLALRDDGELLASAGEDKSIKIWNATNGQAAQPTQLTGFSGPVRGVTFAADGVRVVGVSGNTEANQKSGEVLVFHIGVQPGLLEESIVGHADVVNACVAVGAESRFVSAASDGTTLAWHTNAVRHIVGHSQPVTSLAAMPTGETAQPPELLSGSLDGTVRRWNAVTGQQLAQLAHGGPVTSVAVRGDRQRLASASNNNTIKLWNAANNQQLAQLQGDIRAQSLVAKLTQEKNDATAKVAAATAALDVTEKDLPVKTQAEQTAATTLTAADSEVTAKATALAAVSTTKSQAEQVAIEAAAVAQKATLVMTAAQETAATMVAMAARLAADAERARIAAAANADDAQLAKFHTAAMTAAVTADSQAKAAQAAIAAPTKMATDTAQAAAAAAQKAIEMGTPFNTVANELVLAQSAQRVAKQAHEAAARDLEDATQAVPAGKQALTDAETLLKQLDIELAAATAAEQKSQLPVHTIAFSPDGRTLASGGDFSAVHTWDADTGKAIATYSGHSAAIGQLAYLSDDALVSASGDKSAIVWNLHPDWQLERVIGEIGDPATLVDRVASVDISPDGTLLVAGGGIPSRSGEVKIFRVADGQLVKAIEEPHTDAVSGVAFSPDGQLIATCGADKYVKIFHTASGKMHLQLEGHTNYVTGVAWRSGGKQLASSGSDATLRIWDVETGDRIRTIEGFSKQVSSVAYVGATQFIVSSAGDPLVRMHNSDNGGVQVNFAGVDAYMYSIDAVGDQTSGVVVAGGHDGILRVYRPNGQVIHTLAPPEPATNVPADQQVRVD